MKKKITLNEWIHLSPEQRDEIQGKWKQNWNEWCYLLDEAIENFKGEYGEIQEISRVDPAYKCEPVTHSVSRLTTEPWISVTTSLNGNQYIKDLPSEYAHFKVVQEPFGDIGQEYLEEWILILKNLFGWTEEKTVAWAQEHHSDDLKGKDIWFNHEPPCYYLVDLFFPESKLMSLTSSKKIRFLGKIVAAIYNQSSSPLSVDYDWIAARQRVNDVLREINTSLPK